MVLKGTGVHGNEPTGLESIPDKATAIGGVIGAAFGATLRAAKENLKPKFQESPDLKGDLHRALTNVFLERGVPAEVAIEAANGLVRGQNAQNNPAIAEANRIASSKQTSVDTAQVSEEDIKDKDKAKENQADQETQPEEEGSRTQPIASTVQPPALQTTQNGSSSLNVKALSQPSAQSPSPTTATPKEPQQAAAVSAAKTTLEAPTLSEKPQKAEQSPVSQYKVALPQPTSEMSWNDLQGKTSEITAETGTKPQSRKKADLLTFIEDYRSKQQDQSSEKVSGVEQADKPQEAHDSAVAAAPVFRVPIVLDPTPDLREGYVGAFRAANVDSENAAAASTDLVTGKDASSSAAIKTANKQAQTPRSVLHQMYFEVLAKQGLKPELAERASKDLAEGKGALSSASVREAHDTVLNRELRKNVSLSPSQRDWHQHSRYVTNQDPESRIQATAKNAAAAGLSQKKIESMLVRNSPDVAKMQASAGGSYAANYVRSAASRAIQISQAKGQGKSAIRARSKQGAEV